MPTLIKSTRRLREGFTFLELMIVLAVVSVVLGAIFTSLLVGRSSFMTSDAYVQVQQEARRALDAMSRELRSARDPVTAVGSQLTFQLALGYNLSLTGCAADSVCWGVVDQTGALRPGWSVQYRLAGTQLVRELLNGGAVQNTRVLANDVQLATFAYDGANKLITISLAVTQVSRQLPGGSMPVSPGPLATRVALRN